MNEDEKIDILKLVPAESIDISIAQAIKSVAFDVSKQYVNCAWKQLPDEDKYQLLLNHINVFKNDDLPDLFGQLHKEYHVFVDRTVKHKYKISYSDYNRQLTLKLMEKGYITRNSDKWEKKGNESKHIISGFVRAKKQ